MGAGRRICVAYHDGFPEFIRYPSISSIRFALVVRRYGVYCGAAVLDRVWRAGRDDGAAHADQNPLACDVVRCAAVFYDEGISWLAIVRAIVAGGGRTRSAAAARRTTRRWRVGCRRQRDRDVCRRAGGCIGKGSAHRCRCIADEGAGKPDAGCGDDAVSGASAVLDVRCDNEQ